MLSVWLWPVAIFLGVWFLVSIAAGLAFGMFVQAAKRGEEGSRES